MTTKLITFLSLFFAFTSIIAQPVIHNNLIDAIVEFSSLPEGEQPVRLTSDGSTIYYNNRIGNIYSVNTSGNYFLKYSSSDHSLDEIYGMDYDNSKLYVSGLKFPPGDSTWVGYIMSVDLNNNTWDTLVKFDPLYKAGQFDHRIGFLKIKDNKIYTHMASRTNAGELRPVSEIHGTENLREHYIATKIYEVPIPSFMVTILEDSTWIANSGYLMCSGLRNAFAADFNQNGDFYVSVNSGRRDYPEATYKIQTGDDCGFPFKIAGIDNALTNPNYNASLDTFLLDPPGNNQGFLDPDPNFPQPPTGVNFLAPLNNIGPDADLFRNTHTGQIFDASDLGISIPGVTAHKSPTSLYFDNNNVLPDSLAGTGLQTNYSQASRPLMFDIGEDLLSIKPLSNNSMSVTRLVSGFANPLGVILMGNDAYVLDNNKIWKIIFIEDCSNQQTVYLDQDNDGYGDSATTMNIGECESVPNNYVTNNGDCDDNNPNDMAIFVNQNPIPNGIYEAPGSITSSSTVLANTPMVSFLAGDSIVLLNGFVVESNGDFLGKLTPINCTPDNLNQTTENTILKNPNSEKKETSLNIPELFIFPNPSTNKTSIKYSLPEKSLVNIQIFDNNGKMVSNLVQNKNKSQGEHQILFLTKIFPNGVYSVIFQTEKHRLKKKLVILNKS